MAFLQAEPGSRYQTSWAELIVPESGIAEVTDDKVAELVELGFTPIPAEYKAVLPETSEESEEAAKRSKSVKTALSSESDRVVIAQ